MYDLRKCSFRFTTKVFVMLLIGLFLAVGLWAVSIVYASIPDSNGVIHACYDGGNGTLRVIDAEAGAACRPQEVALSWNQRGPQGPQGPQGPEGPRGPSDGYVTTLLPANAKRLTGHVHVLSLSLPAGDYILSASARLERSQSGSSTVLCDFLVGGGAFAPLYLEKLNGVGDVEILAATTGVSLASDEMVHLRCDGSFDDTGTFVTAADLTAIRVGTVTRQ